MSGGSGYLSTAWDNTVDWELSCDIMFSADACGITIIKPSETSRDKNELMLTRGNIFKYVNGSSTVQTGCSLTNNNNWYSLKITKSNGELTYNANNITQTVNWSLLSTLTGLCIGVDSWGATASIKNIVVKPL